MREIKFRAWDKLTGKMLSWEYLLSVHPSINLFFNEPDIILMQYTGLKDKGGKEIYEGDILQWSQPAKGGWSKSFGMKFEVVWDNLGCWYPCYGINMAGATVIGNIYETEA